MSTSDAYNPFEDSHAAHAARASTVLGGAPPRRPAKRQRIDDTSAADGPPLHPHAPPRHADVEPTGSALEALADELRELARAIAPTPLEHRRRTAAFRMLADLAVSQLAGVTHSDVHLFGSGASGLCTHASDLDIVITGLAHTGRDGGFDPTQKTAVVRALRRLEYALRYAEPPAHPPPRHTLLIGHARVPVLKVTLDDGLQADISINDSGGVAAADFTRQQVAQHPALPPLVMALKMILSQQGLSEVASGGLGGWALTNLVVAHLQMEMAAGADGSHCGQLLLGFLRRFGELDCWEWGVSVARGGIVRRPRPGSGRDSYSYRLYVEDPLTGRDVSGGTHRIADVQAAFHAAASALTEALRRAVPTVHARQRHPHHQQPQQQQPQRAAHEGGKPSWSLLGVVLDVEGAVSRGGGGGRNVSRGSGGGRNGGQHSGGGGDDSLERVRKRRG